MTEMTSMMTIGGKAVEGIDSMPVENPATGENFAEAPACSAAELDRAVCAARDTFPRWASLPHQQRATGLIDCANALDSSIEEIARLVTLEQGKPLRESLAEVRLSADWFRRVAELSAPPEDLGDSTGGNSRITMDRVPHGVVAAITPASYPVLLAVVKIAPALLAGNTVVLKPAPSTPLSSLRLGEILNDALLPGALNVVSGRAELGPALTGHPYVKLISFTGSISTGQRVARAAAPEFKRVVLELGGNDACILLPGVDVAGLAGEIFRLSMVNCGQFCAAIKRVYVARDQEQELVDALASLARSATVGDGLDPATDLGPLTTAEHLESVTELVSDAVNNGARVVTGGTVLERPGHFFPPTIVSEMPASTRLEGTEQFAPIIPVLAYDDISSTVKRANGTHYALGGSVWGPEAEAREVAAGLDSGTVWVNTHGDLRHDVPFGGHRASGMGVEYGYWGLLEYTQIRVTNVAQRPAR
jgi:acyl-CoA reductase-like NAD-dependent aldehyde dehydrogenase